MMDLFIYLHFAYIYFNAYCNLQDGYNRAGFKHLVELRNNPNQLGATQD